MFVGVLSYMPVLYYGGRLSSFFIKLMAPFGSSSSTVTKYMKATGC